MQPDAVNKNSARASGLGDCGEALQNDDNKEGCNDIVQGVSVRKRKH